jgi:hypothetical protein
VFGQLVRSRPDAHIYSAAIMLQLRHVYCIALSILLQWASIQPFMFGSHSKKHPTPAESGPGASATTSDDGTYMILCPCNS